MDSNQTATAAQDRMQTAYGHGAGAIPWAQIVAMIMSMLSGCTKPPAQSPTPAEVKARAKSFLGKVQFMRRLHAQGIYGQQAERVHNAFITTLDAATDDEVTAMVNAALESE